MNKHVKTEREFLKLIGYNDSQKQEQISLQDISVSEKVRIKGNFNNHIFLQDNCHIDYLEIDSIDSNKEIHIGLGGTSFINRLEISNVRNGLSLYLRGNSQIVSFRLRKSKSITFNWTGNSIVGGAYIFNSEIKMMSVTENSKLSFLTISDQSNCTSIDITKSVRIQIISIGDWTKVNYLRIAATSKIEALKIGNRCTIKHLILKGNSHLKSAEILDSQIGSFELIEESNTDFLEIRGYSRIDNFLIKGDYKLKRVELKGYSKINGLEISELGQINILFITEYCHLDELILSGGSIGILKFSDLETNTIKLRGTGTKFRNDIELGNVKTDNLEFLDYSTNVGMRLINIFPKSEGIGKIRLERSDLGSSFLNNVDLGDFKDMFFTNSKVNECFFSNTNFPNYINTIHQTKSPLHFAQIKQLHEQLKTAYLNQGNKVASSKHQALELKAYLTQITLSMVLEWKKLSFWKNEFLDLVTLLFHYLTTDFGTNWFKGFKSLILISIILYVLVIWSTDNISPEWPWNMNYTQFDLFVTHFFDFINPTSFIWKKWEFLEILENGTIDWPTKSLLLLSKGLIVTLIYQIVQALRKFGRR